MHTARFRIGSLLKTQGYGKDIVYLQQNTKKNIRNQKPLCLYNDVYDSLV